MRGGGGIGHWTPIKTSNTKNDNSQRFKNSPSASSRQYTRIDRVNKARSTTKRRLEAERQNKRQEKQSIKRQLREETETKQNGDKSILQDGAFSQRRRPQIDAGQASIKRFFKPKA